MYQNVHSSLPYHFSERNFSSPPDAPLGSWATGRKVFHLFLELRGKRDGADRELEGD